MEKISREKAIELGLPHYFTGDPCRNGHIEKRQTSYRNCLGCMREANDRRVNKNPDATKQRIKEWKQKNRERKKELNKKWANENKEKNKELKKVWTKNNRHLVNQKEARRRAGKQKRIPKWFGELDEFVFSEGFSLAKKRKDSTGIEWHVDHMIPMHAKEASGLHCASNIQVIPSALNTKKQNKMICTEFAEWIKFC